MTRREKEVFQIVKKISGEFGEKAHPKTIGMLMNITSDYAQILCREMVSSRYLVKKGIYYEIAPDYLQEGE